MKKSMSTSVVLEYGLIILFFAKREYQNKKDNLKITLKLPFYI